MIQVRQTLVYSKWIEGLRDRDARSHIDARVRRLTVGNAGDVRPVGMGISELRINFGPGYRVYYRQRGDVLILLLCGGDKSSQSRDIEGAKQLASEWEI
jgi:putative addiction module killer protein